MQRLGILGCGDFLRWQADAISSSKNVAVTRLFDPDTDRASKFAERLGGQLASSAEALIDDAEVDFVLLFVPPWVRRDLFLRALKAGKAILTTKPLSNTIEGCKELVAACRQHPDQRVAVIYGRSGDASVSSMKRLLDSGEVGSLALYRQDWIHPYPQWNKWALDHARNGGPFLDAMIHNLNAACHLMSGSLEKAAFFSSNLAHADLMEADTEALHATFAGGGVAHLFITWAADLATHSTDGNDREHIDLFYLVTDQGWRLTKEWQDDGQVIKASRTGEDRFFPCEGEAETTYDQFAASMADPASPGPSCLATIEEAARDVMLLRSLEATPGILSDWQGV